MSADSEASERSGTGDFAALWRALIAWSPAIVALLLLTMTDPVRSQGWRGPWPVSLVLAAFAAAAVWAATHPSRGLQDRLAGTWIVPR